MKTLQTPAGLTGNQLKIIAMIAMTCDHVGLQLLPKILLLRMIGRLAMPIYAFLIAEGCRHTRDRKRYLLRMSGMAALCQVVYFVAMGSLYQCILVTFSLSICLIYLAEEFLDGKRWRFFLGLAAVFFLCSVLPEIWTSTDFSVDYGLWGVMLPVFIYFGGTRGLICGLVLLSLSCGGIQWLGLAAVPLLLCYNGRRGKANLGRLFYWYYPLHLVAIYGISLLIGS